MINFIVQKAVTFAALVSDDTGRDGIEPPAGSRTVRVTSALFVMYTGYATPTVISCEMAIKHWCGKLPFVFHIIAR